LYLKTAEHLIRGHASANALTRKFHDRTDIGAQVRVMKESVFFMTYIDKSGIQAWHHLFDFAKKNVAYGKLIGTPLLMKFGQSAVFKQSNINACRR
jgi:hypothetical protein